MSGSNDCWPGEPRRRVSVYDVIDAINAVAPTWDLAGFLDDARAPGSHHLGLRVLGRLRDAGRFLGHEFANAIGSDRSYRHLPEIAANLMLRKALAA